MNDFGTEKVVGSALLLQLIKFIVNCISVIIVVSLITVNHNVMKMIRVEKKILHNAKVQKG